MKITAVCCQIARAFILIVPKTGALPHCDTDPRQQVSNGETTNQGFPDVRSAALMLFQQHENGRLSNGISRRWCGCRDGGLAGYSVSASDL
jgi:hypothetical protein